MKHNTPLASRIGIGLPAALAVVMALMGDPLAEAEAETDADSSTWTMQADEPGCNGAELAVPQQSPAYYAEHPDLFADDEDATPQVRAELDEIALEQPTVITQADCYQSDEPRLHSAPDMSADMARRNAASGSYNWAGYWTGKKSFLIYAVTMDWTVPKVSATSAKTDVSIWPGLGSGASSSDQLVQAGTAQYSKSTYFWYEIYPFEYEVAVKGIAVVPGNHVRVIVSFNTSKKTANFYFYNQTRHTFMQVAQKLTKGKFVGHQAEWVIERPMISGHYAVLPKFSNIPTSRAWYLRPGAKAWTSLPTGNRITMVNSAKKTLVALSAAKKSAFTATWKRAA